VFGEAPALRGVTLSIDDGQMLGIVGPSGAGKSTLLRIVNRLVEPSGGAIYAYGRNVLALQGREVREWRAACGMIFQQFNLVNRLDVLTNVLLGRVHWQSPLRVALQWFPEADRAVAAHALDRLGMLPQAFQRAESLSGGQQQRVAIARALVQNPRLLLADEPIASLDPLNSTLVMDALRQINREDGITIVCSLHQVEVALRYCDRIVGLAHGQVVFDASTADLSPADLAGIYGAARSDLHPHGAGVSSASGHAETRDPLDLVCASTTEGRP
jgi:phosphonate transport system ATP-binding protein